MCHSFVHKCDVDSLNGFHINYRVVISFAVNCAIEILFTFYFLLNNTFEYISEPVLFTYLSEYLDQYFHFY